MDDTARMGDSYAAVSDLLREAAELHHRTYRITDGADDDWASWYADWLVYHSELPRLLGRPPVRSEITWLLVSADRADRVTPSGDWAAAYARIIVDHHGTGEDDDRLRT